MAIVLLTRKTARSPCGASPPSRPWIQTIGSLMMGPIQATKLRVFVFYVRQILVCRVTQRYAPSFANGAVSVVFYCQAGDAAPAHDDNGGAWAGQLTLCAVPVIPPVRCYEWCAHLLCPCEEGAAPHVLGEARAISGFHMGWRYPLTGPPQRATLPLKSISPSSESLC